MLNRTITVVLFAVLALAGCKKKEAGTAEGNGSGDMKGGGGGDARYKEIKDKMCSCAPGDTACGQLAATAMDGWVTLHSKAAKEVDNTEYEKCKTAAMTPAAGSAPAAGSGSAAAGSGSADAGSGSGSGSAK